MRNIKIDSNVGGHRPPRFFTQNFESTPLLAPGKENDMTSLFAGWFFLGLHYANYPKPYPTFRGATSVEVSSMSLGVSLIFAKRGGK